MLSDRDIQIFLAENRTQTNFKDGIIISEIFEFTNCSIEINNVFLNPNSRFENEKSNQCFLSYIGDLTTDSELIIDENTLFSDSKICSFQNLHADEAINFIQFKIDGFAFQENQFSSIQIDDIEANTLSNYLEFKDIPLKIQVGKFEGRFEKNLNQSGHFLIYVIEGVFEIEGCLLETNDVLILKNQKNIEIESLSNEALLIIFSDYE